MKKRYEYSFKTKNELPTVIVKWCRRNFGERAIGWDFTLVGGRVIIEIWNDEFITMYELWHE